MDTKRSQDAGTLGKGGDEKGSAAAGGRGPVAERTERSVSRSSRVLFADPLSFHSRSCMAHCRSLVSLVLGLFRKVTRAAAPIVWLSLYLLVRFAYVTGYGYSIKKGIGLGKGREEKKKARAMMVIKLERRNRAPGAAAAHGEGSLLSG